MYIVYNMIKSIPYHILSLYEVRRYDNMFDIYTQIKSCSLFLRVNNDTQHYKYIFYLNFDLI